MARHVVATTSEIPAGGNKVVTVGGRERVFQTLDWSRLRWIH